MSTASSTSQRHSNADGTTTNVLGQAVTAIRYADGDPNKAYWTDVTGYDSAYRPLGTRVTIPDVDGNGWLAGTYDTPMTYDNDGLDGDHDAPGLRVPRTSSIACDLQVLHNS